MSVIVKNMELTAESCLACRFLVCDDFEEIFECTALEKFMGKDELPKGRRSDCPLVELIRCKDCKHRVLIDMTWRCLYSDFIVPEHYCGYAERKE